MKIDKDDLVENAFKAFSEFEKPEHCTNYEHCEECAEHDQTLIKKTKTNLSIEDVGTVCWGPVPFMTMQALMYFMPRLIELAVNKAFDKDRDPYFLQFINSFFDLPNSDRIHLFGKKQIEIMLKAFEYLEQEYYQLIEYHCWEDELKSAIKNWKSYLTN